MLIWGKVAGKVAPQNSFRCRAGTTTSKHRCCNLRTKDLYQLEFTMEPSRRRVRESRAVHSLQPMINLVVVPSTQMMTPTMMMTTMSMPHMGLTFQ